MPDKLALKRQIIDELIEHLDGLMAEDVKPKEVSMEVEATEVPTDETLVEGVEPAVEGEEEEDEELAEFMKSRMKG